MNGLANWVIFMALPSLTVASDLQLINDSPRLLIGSGKVITRNERRISAITAASSAFDMTITVQWNMTPASTESFPCCPFTILEVYPLDGSGVKITGETVVLLKPNITNYVINASTTNATDYLICVRLWHRFAGQERKLDESCVRTRILLPENSTTLMIIVFAIVITVNITLILTMITVKFVRSSHRKAETAGSFALRKWWADFTDLLQPGRNDESGRNSVTTNSGILEPRNNTVNFLPSPYFTHRLIKPQSTIIHAEDLFAPLNNTLRPLYQIPNNVLHNLHERNVVSSADSGISGGTPSTATFANSPTLTERSALSHRTTVEQPVTSSLVHQTTEHACVCCRGVGGGTYRPQYYPVEANNPLFFVHDLPHYNRPDASRIAIV